MPFSRRYRTGSRVMSSPSMEIEPDVDLPRADDGIDQLGLSVALDAGDTNDFAPMHRHADVVDDGRSPSLTVTLETSSTTMSVTVDSVVFGCR